MGATLRFALCAVVAAALANACNAPLKPPVKLPETGQSQDDGGPGVPDGGADGGMANDAGQAEPCGDVFACEGACRGDGAAACRARCDDAGTPAARQLAQALDTCISALCTQTSDGVCVTGTADCLLCLADALTGGCQVLYAVCEEDQSGAPDGGSIGMGDAGSPTHDAGPRDAGTGATDAGEGFSDGGASDGGAVAGSDDCFQISLCSDGCATTACTQRCLQFGTSGAQTQYTGLLTCIYGACPTTDGGVCDSTAPGYDSSACGTCASGSESPGHPCYGDALACNGTYCATPAACSATPGTPFCDSSLGYCVQCQSPGDCASGSGCIDYICQPADLSCIGVYGCTYGCADDTCRQNCASGGIPSAQTDFEGYMRCQDVACPSTGGGVCDTTARGYSVTNCDACIQTAQSGVCLAQIEACLSNCEVSSDCTSDPTKAACDPVTRTCVECVLSSDCGTGRICASNVCIRTCQSASDCPSDETCSGGICVASGCASDADCTDPTLPHCDLSTHLCGP